MQEGGRTSRGERRKPCSNEKGRSEEGGGAAALVENVVFLQGLVVIMSAVIWSWFGRASVWGRHSG